jgi:translation initiation factor 1
MMNDPNVRLVYSTDPMPPATGGKVRVRYETSGRKGKGVTVISGLPLGEEGLRELARQLKSRLGAGGAVKGQTIEVQGDQRKKVPALLREQGFAV